jgi:hypothetical protein
VSDPLGLCPVSPYYQTKAYVESGQMDEDIEKGARQVASAVVGALPIAGEIHDASQVLTKRDHIADENLTTSDQVVTGLAIAAPLAGGKAMRWLANTGPGQAVVSKIDEGWQYLRGRWDAISARVNAPEGGLPSTPTAPITDPSRLLPPPARANPYPEGAPLFAGPAPKGLEIEMVMAPGQSRPGGFGTTDIVPSVDYARTELAITPDFKPEIGSVQRWSVPEGTQIQWGPVGPQQSGGVTYPGGGTQVEILNYDERQLLKPVGPRLPLKQE